MYSVWKLVKSIDFKNSSITAKFYTLYEDKRDIMSDAWKPQMGPSDLHKVVIEHRDKTLFCREVGRDEGNRMYKDIVVMSKIWNPYFSQGAVEEWGKNGEWVDMEKKEWFLEDGRFTS